MNASLIKYRRRISRLCREVGYKVPEGLDYFTKKELCQFWLFMVKLKKEVVLKQKSWEMIRQIKADSLAAMESVMMRRD